MLKTSCVCHVAHHGVRQQLELVRRAIGEGALEVGEELVDLMQSVGVAERTQNTHRFVARPDRPARTRVAVVKGKLSLVQRGLYPEQEVVVVAHLVNIL